ncbi:vacuolar protein sorting 55, partial [Piptocephalis cylindrospora]
SIIALAFLLACGFLLIILSCSLYGNWWPLLVALTFAIAPIPNRLCLRCGISEDLLEDTQSGFIDAGIFITSILLVSGVSLPILLSRASVIQVGAAIQCILGGSMVYGTIVAYNRFFSHEEDTL